jgi:hypothetical protein
MFQTFVSTGLKEPIRRLFLILIVWFFHHINHKKEKISDNYSPLVEKVGKSYGIMARGRSVYCDYVC